MSDISIPGLSDRFNTREIVDRLMEVERRPLDRVEGQVELLGAQRSAVLDLNRRISFVRDRAKELFGFRNPFDEKIASSTAPAVLTATAARDALEDTSQMRVLSVAAADKFASQSLPRGFRPPAGTYVFGVGDDTVSINFTGGTLTDLATAVNRRSDGLLEATVIPDSAETQIFAIEATRTGAANRLTFAEAAVEFGVDSGLIRPSGQGALDVNLAGAQSRSAEPDSFALADGVLTARPGATLRIPVPAITLTANHELHYEFKVTQLPVATADTTPPKGPTIPDAGTVSLEGITVRNAPSRAVLPSFEPPPPPRVVDDLDVLAVESGGRRVTLPALSVGAEFRERRDRLEPMTSIDALLVENRNTHRVVELRNMQIVDRTARGDHVPGNPVSEAADARLELDGIEVRRSENLIDDLLPGVTLTVHAPSTQPVTLEVSGDDELVKGQILEFFGGYNRLLTEIDVLSRADDVVVDDARFFSADEQDAARARLGLFQGDLSLIQLKNALQRTMMNAYPTDAENDLSLLAQAGISTDVRRAGTGLDRTRLRGYLEVDEQSLDRALASRRRAVRQLFGNDTDADLIVDSGVAFSVDRLLTTYVQPNGIMDARVTTLDRGISQRNRQAETLEERLSDREQELRREFAQMQASVDSLQQSQQALQNFNRQGQ